jgi:uncharacterized protein (DUF885 family)
MSALQDLEKLTDEFIESSCRLSPVTATFWGIHTYDEKLDELSREALARNLAELKGFEQRLVKEIDPASLVSSGQADYQVFLNMVRSSIAEQERFRWHERMPSLYADIALYSIFLLMTREFAPIEDRLRGVASRLEQFPRLLDEGKANTVNPPVIYTQVAIEVAEGAVSFLKEAVTPMAERVPALKERFLAAAAKAQAATEGYLAWLKADLLPKSTGAFAVGEELFRFKLQTDLMIDMTCTELLWLGYKTIAAAKRQLSRLAKRMDPTKSWAQVVDKIKDDHPSAAELLGFYRTQMERARDYVVQKGLAPVPEGERLDVIETPVFERSTTPYAAYMSPAPFEKDQRGMFYVTPVDASAPPEKQRDQLRGHCRKGAIVVSLHEGYPGHHLQLVYANQSPSRLRRIAHNAATIEGWALYCEEMMREQGFYGDPETMLMQLRDTLWRACRVVVDVGLHTAGMTFQKAVDFMVEEAHLERTNAEAEVKRYTMSPTQPLSYIVGKHEIMKMRNAYKRMKRRAYRLSDFHTDFLKVSNLPTKLIAEQLLNEKPWFHKKPGF